MSLYLHPHTFYLLIAALSLLLAVASGFLIGTFVTEHRSSVRPRKEAGARW